MIHSRRVCNKEDRALNDMPEVENRDAYNHSKNWPEGQEGPSLLVPSLPNIRSAEVRRT